MCKTQSFLLAIIFSVILNEAQAQFFYKPGKIITNSNDTISAFIRDKGNIKNSKQCRYKMNLRDKPKTFLPNEIKGYQLHNGKYLYALSVLIKNDYQPRFTDVLIDGTYSIYFYRKNKNQMFYMGTPDNLIIGLSNESIKINTTSSGFNYQSIYAPSNFYKDSLFEAFKNWEPILKKLPSLEYTAKDITTITKEYTEATCPTAKCINYVQDTKLNKALFGFYMGSYLTKINVVYYDISSSWVPSFTSGLFYKVPLSLISSHIDFQTELLWRKLSGNFKFENIERQMVDLDIESNTLGLPLIINYNLHNNNKLSFGIGLGYEYGVVFESKIKYKGQVLQPDGTYEFEDISKVSHRFQRGAWLTDLSINYKLNKAMWLYSGLRYQLLENLILEEENDQRLTFNSAISNTDALKYKSALISFRIGLMF